MTATTLEKGVFREAFAQVFALKEFGKMFEFLENTSPFFPNPSSERQHSLQAGRRYPARVAGSGGVRVLRGSYPGRVRGERRAV